jgi:hypothetical protein
MGEKSLLPTPGLSDVLDIEIRQPELLLIKDNADDTKSKSSSVIRKV